MKFSTTNAALLTGGIAATGTWVEDRTLSHRIIVGGVIFAIGLAVMDEISEDLAQAFALLALVGVTFRYGEPILNGLGYGNTPTTSRRRSPHPRNVPGSGPGTGSVSA